jgi:hypothetical protein
MLQVGSTGKQEEEESIHSHPWASLKEDSYIVDTIISKYSFMDLNKKHFKTFCGELKKNTYLHLMA